MVFYTEWPKNYWTMCNINTHRRNLTNNMGNGWGVGGIDHASIMIPVERRFSIFYVSPPPK
jgi:hypothetical protein